MKAYINSIRSRRHPSHENGKRVTQADLSRTIRQILVDTMLGRPTPAPLTYMSQDGTAHTDERGKLIDDQDVEKLHALRVAEDKFDAFNMVRESKEHVKQQDEYIKNKVKDARKKIKDAQAQEKKKVVEELNQLRKQVNTNTAQQ